MNQDIQVLKSALDQSVNFTYRAPNFFSFEARYVRREQAYFITYLSSQSGCAAACRFCWLTASGQNKLDNATFEDFMKQAALVMEYYDKTEKAELVHFNFMARGEALNNPLILENSARLLNALKQQADERNLKSKFLISTILPRSLGDLSLMDIFPEVHPEIYYSLYSMKPEFRKRWLAKAHSAEHGLEMLKAWQEATGKTPKIHFAFIEGENDSEQDMELIGNAINAVGLKCNLNIVRYNPYDARYGREPEEAVIHRNTDLLTSLIKPEAVRIVPRVGKDVFASCGTFIEVAK
ncbi:radical SAM enzyme, Cfr family protein (plasmid) [Pseudomonas sp. Leaf58]|uniref:hypothetical protein n=1 Tax=Pseudomonas sp. Leaf58 TaxID=1736226 RepID=UPI0006FE5500|nr:hypothetical protein [Pseudomonas sp. Leaf58]AYG48010.1 radical SAM enzyme, Cfr family protein [Pseudomonas sp. Leaf58]KQN62432.1 hypothetical protein ASF02_09795 [Pseudomonas sp. Leaf58]